MLLSIRALRRIAPRIVLALAISACGNPSDDAVRKDFHRAHPAYPIVTVYNSEGDFDSASFTIKYHKPGERLLYMDCWRYEKIAGQWRVAAKATTDEKHLPARFCR